MWKDIETAEDLLGYRFHAKLLKDPQIRNL